MIEEKLPKAQAIHILKVLERFSDEDHPLSQSQIKDHLEEEYDCTLERKAIGRYISDLLDLGYNIEGTDKRGGLYLGTRVFENYELIYLIDAIYSSKVIERKDANILVDSITSTLSDFDKEKFMKNNIKYSGSIYKVNKMFFQNVDDINKAIMNHQKIRYHSFAYDNNGNRIEKYNGYGVICSPYYTVNSQGNYYLLCGIKRRGYDETNLAVVKIDRIEKVEILKEKTENLENVIGLGNGFDVSEYLQKHIYLYGGNTVSAKLLVKNDRMANKYNPKSFNIMTIKEWFGDKAKIEYDGANCYAYVTCNENALKFWAMQYSQSFVVLEPLKVKQDIKELLLASLKDYE